MNRIFTPWDATVLVLLGALIGVSLGFFLGVVVAERIHAERAIILRILPTNTIYVQPLKPAEASEGTRRA